MSDSPPGKDQCDEQASASLETLMQRVAGIVESLESENMPLDAAIAAYTEGMLTIRNAQQKLLDAEQRVLHLQALDNEDDDPSPGI